MNGKMFLKEFLSRIEIISQKPLNECLLSDLATVTRTLEAMERTYLARIRTWCSGITVGLGVIGVILLFLRIFVLT